MTTEILNGYLRVTSVISRFSGIDKIPKEILEPAAERGSLTHKYIELILKGEEIHVIPSHIQPYIDSFKLFWDSSSHAFEKGDMELEKRLYCDKYMITGAIDCIIKIPDKTYLIDWKTSASFHKSFRLQAAAYRYLCDINGYKNTDDLLVVRLNKDGKKPTLHKHDSYEADLSIFMECLSVYKWFNHEKWPGRSTVSPESDFGNKS